MIDYEIQRMYNLFEVAICDIKHRARKNFF